ncbi:MAG: energy-coupling factor ABC transporter permease [Candidatus Amulumruptor caecigallinarius]|nr:energy-coupling factor ABC transporter permease [Candidatus Amulumruptor caecigallinarius]
MADALVSPAVAAGAAVVSVAALAVAASKVKKSAPDNIVPLMGVVGAFIFAAQMINFSIPGTGSSGHIVGGVLAATLLGPWAGLITIASVLVVQCLVFADGGLMALGCNILNMGICTALIGYGLIYRPIVGRSLKLGRIMTGSVAACIIGLEIGALLVTFETELSGVTALSWGSFLTLMTSIHFAIGACEGVATGLLLYFVAKSRPALLLREDPSPATAAKEHSLRPVLIVFGVLALIFGVTFTWIASSHPDGLEWSIEQLTGATDVVNNTAAATRSAFSNVQNATSVIPDYESTWSGIIGCLMVVVLTWGVLSCLRLRKSHVVAK